MKIPVIDDIGYIEIINVCGSEEMIRKIAGLSHDSKDGPTIENLLKWNHMSPFEFASITFKIKCPIFVARQLFRHRTGHYMEKSLRYCESKAEFYTPKNGYQSIHRLHNEASYEAYTWLLKKGQDKEKARAVLPMSTYTEYYFQMDLRNLIHKLEMRTDTSAQPETRAYAQEMTASLYIVFPTVYEYLTREKK